MTSSNNGGRFPPFECRCTATHNGRRGSEGRSGPQDSLCLAGKWWTYSHKWANSPLRKAPRRHKFTVQWTCSPNLRAPTPATPPLEAPTLIALRLSTRVTSMEKIQVCSQWRWEPEAVSYKFCKHLQWNFSIKDTLNRRHLLMRALSAVSTT